MQEGFLVAIPDLFGHQFSACPGVVTGSGPRLTGGL